MASDNPIGDMFTEFRRALDEYLASILQKAVDGEIITDTQRDELIDLAHRN
jgi:hypothetical protein